MAAHDRTSLRIRGVGLALALVATLAACGDDDGAADGTEARIVTVYTGRHYGIEPVFAQFTADTGIEVRFTTGSDPELRARLTAEGAVWTFLGDAQEDGRPVKRVQVDQIRYLDEEITREVIAVDPELMALLRITMYAGSGRVFDVRLTDFTWTPTVAPDAFSS